MYFILLTHSPILKQLCWEHWRQSSYCCILQLCGNHRLLRLGASQVCTSCFASADLRDIVSGLPACHTIQDSVEHLSSATEALITIWYSYLAPVGTGLTADWYSTSPDWVQSVSDVPYSTLQHAALEISTSAGPAQDWTLGVFDFCIILNLIM